MDGARKATDEPGNEANSVACSSMLESMDETEVQETDHDPDLSSRPFKSIKREIRGLHKVNAYSINLRRVVSDAFHPEVCNRRYTERVLCFQEKY